MKTTRSFLAGLLLVGGFVANGSADDVLSETDAASGNNYCHLQFSAIEERTLADNQPVLKSLDSGDITDFYGPAITILGGKMKSNRKDEFPRIAHGPNYSD
jgi:hypothetical protein